MIRLFLAAPPLPLQIFLKIPAFTTFPNFA